MPPAPLKILIVDGGEGKGVHSVSFGVQKCTNCVQNYDTSFKFKIANVWQDVCYVPSLKFQLQIGETRKLNKIVDLVHKMYTKL